MAFKMKGPMFFKSALKHTLKGVDGEVYHRQQVDGHFHRKMNAKGEFDPTEIKVGSDVGKYAKTVKNK